MPNFQQISKAFKKLAINFDTFFEEIFKKESIVRHITNTVQDRLYKEGRTGTGVQLLTDGKFRDESKTAYSRITTFLKLRKGDPVNRVTLFDEGFFYSTFEVVATKFRFEILADFESGKDAHMYENFNVLFNSEKTFENAVTSLTKEELTHIIKNYAEIELKKKIEKTLKAA